MIFYGVASPVLNLSNMQHMTIRPQLGKGCGRGMDVPSPAWST